jgi:hypothetical protein
MIKEDCTRDEVVVAALRQQIGVLRGWRWRSSQQKGSGQNLGDHPTMPDGEFFSAVAAMFEFGSTLLLLGKEKDKDESDDPSELLSFLIPEVLSAHEEIDEVWTRIHPYNKYSNKTDNDEDNTNKRKRHRLMMPATSSTSTTSNSDCVSTDVQKFTDLPEALLENILSYLLFKENVTFSSVNKSCQKLAHNTECVRIGPINCGRARIDEALLCASRQYYRLRRIQVQFANKITADDAFYMKGLLLDNLFRSAPLIKAVILVFDDCDVPYIEALMKGTRDLCALSSRQHHHSSLELLHLFSPRFASSQNAAKLLRPLQHLTELILDGMTFSSEGSASLLSVVEAIQGMKKLKKLSLADQNFDDEQISCLLAGLQELRFLDLGCLKQEQSTLSDKSQHAIANSCPKLQYLDVAGHETLTCSALKVVLTLCPIRELGVASTTVQPCNFKEITQTSRTLLIIYWRLPEEESSITKDHVKHLNEAITACQGRVVFHCVGVGPYEFPPTLSESVLSCQQETKKIVQKIRYAGLVPNSPWEEYLNMP